jgi:hypothetical protein
LWFIVGEAEVAPGDGVVEGVLQVLRLSFGDGDMLSSI